jgi:hypothetical protein
MFQLRKLSPSLVSGTYQAIPLPNPSTLPLKLGHFSETSPQEHPSDDKRGNKGQWLAMGVSNSLNDRALLAGKRDTPKAQDRRNHRGNKRRDEIATLLWGNREGATPRGKGGPGCQNGQNVVKTF